MRCAAHAERVTGSNSKPLCKHGKHTMNVFIDIHKEPTICKPSVTNYS